MSTYVLVSVCVSVCGMYVMLCYVILFYYVYTYIRVCVCMPARAQEGGGGDAGGDGGLGWVGREGGETEQNII